MMKNRLATLLCFLVCLLVCGFAPAMAQQPAYPFNDPTLQMEKRIDNLLSLMTVDEKIACLGTYSGVPRLGVMNFGSSEGIHGVVQREPRGKRLPITTTQFPQPPGMGESWDPELVRQGEHGVVVVPVVLADRCLPDQLAGRGVHGVDVAHLAGTDDR